MGGKRGGKEKERGKQDKRKQLMENGKKEKKEVKIKREKNQRIKYRKAQELNPGPRA